MNSWTDKDMKILSTISLIALSISLALLITIPACIEKLQERIEILESNNETRN